MPSTTPRLLVVDQSLRGFAGHHYDYSRAVIEAAAAQGLEVLLAPNHAFPENNLAGARVVGRFSGAWNEAGLSSTVGTARNILARLPDGPRHLLVGAAARLRPSTAPLARKADCRFAQELTAILAAAKMRECDHALIHTVGDAELLGLGETMPGRARIPGLLHIVLRFDGTPATRDALGKLQETATRIRFWTDTQALAEQYRELGAREIGVLPIPHGLRDFRPPPRQHGQPLTISYLGGARGDKGFDSLPGLVEALAAEFLESGRARFLVQASYSLSLEEPLMARTKQALKRFPREWVEVIEAPLSSGDFERALVRSDILLLPYRPEIYRRRSSGLLIQAMVCGIPTILPEGTWLETEAPKAGHVAFGGQVTLAEATRTAINQHQDLSAAARAVATSARERHDAEKLVRCLTG
jgi:glycosyltransferase involved in cell wall biosynthesis